MSKADLVVNQMVMELATRRLAVVRQVRGGDCVVEWCVSRSPAYSMESRSCDKLCAVVDPLVSLSHQFPGVCFELESGVQPCWPAGPFQLRMQYQGVLTIGQAWRCRCVDPGGVGWMVAIRGRDQYDYYRQGQLKALLFRLSCWFT